ncbi:hypothetical protein CR513_46824, partial [Mucuna pruriens]
MDESPRFLLSRGMTKGGFRWFTYLNKLLGSKNCNKCTRNDPYDRIVFGRVITRKF